MLNIKYIRALFMGFASGLPLLLTLQLLQAWLQDEGASLTLIGLVSLIGLPYSLKFLWAPLFDRFEIGRFGRRRGWLMVVQMALIFATLLLSFSDPTDAPIQMGIAAFCIAFFSASQDILIDAYRREDLSETEQGPGASFYLVGYRIGMVVPSSGAFILADWMPFAFVYQVMALLMLVGFLTTVFAKEPAPTNHQPASLKAAVWLPLKDFMTRDRVLWILAFILLYKLGDTLAATMTTPFLLTIGYTKTEIGVTAQFFGFWATIIGGLLGAYLMARIRLKQALFYFGVLQIISTAGFLWLLQQGAPDLTCLGVVMGFENAANGMASSAFIAFLASLTNRDYSAFQFALLTSLFGVPRVIFAAPAGLIAEAYGFATFFIVCTVVALPGLWLICRLTDQSKNDALIKSKPA